jgi:hypothetical protein
VTGHHTKIAHDDPLAMYFHDISKVEILGKERELELAHDMRQIMHNFHSTIASTTLAVKKFIVLGEKLKSGAIFVDEFSITSLRPDEQSPADIDNLC